ncbi:MAG TPA: hypothetical protein VFK30_12235, partial [Anaerolineae bacterium]|nr:hypothetical protein [Anaerolineae bacterium]
RSISGTSPWSTLIEPTTTGVLAAGANISITVTIDIPATTTQIISSTTMISAQSQSQITNTVMFSLTSTAIPYQVYLPIVIR